MAMYHGIVLGTFPYMAPELYQIILNDTNDDGCVIYCCYGHHCYTSIVGMIIHVMFGR